jgi:hypothetical protein
VNADVMITIAFCLIVLLGSLAEGLLFALSVRNDKAKEAETRRRQKLITCRNDRLWVTDTDEGRQALARAIEP